MNLLLLFLFGVFVGVLSGLMGIGGGIVLVPGLMLLFGFSQPEAQGTSLAVLIPPRSVKVRPDLISMRPASLDLL